MTSLRGFTLIETLIAIALTGLLIAGTMTSLRQSAAASKRTESRDRELRILEGLIEIIGQDFRGAATPRDFANDREGFRVECFRGARGQITFFTTHDSRFELLGTSGRAIHVTYRLFPSEKLHQWTLTREERAPFGRESEGVPVLLTEELRAFEIEPITAGGTRWRSVDSTLPAGLLLRLSFGGPMREVTISR